MSPHLPGPFTVEFQSARGWETAQGGNGRDETFRTEAEANRYAQGLVERVGGPLHARVTRTIVLYSVSRPLGQPESSELRRD